MTAFDDDRQFFQANPERVFRCRLATPEEIEAVFGEPSGLSLPYGCSIFALARRDRETTLVETMHVALEDGSEDLDEQECIGEHSLGIVLIACGVVIVTVSMIGWQ